MAKNTALDAQYEQLLANAYQFNLAVTSKKTRTVYKVAPRLANESAPVNSAAPPAN